jgi:hypothetical protein
MFDDVLGKYLATPSATKGGAQPGGSAVSQSSCWTLWECTSYAALSDRINAATAQQRNCRRNRLFPSILRDAYSGMMVELPIELGISILSESPTPKSLWITDLG